MKPSGTINSGRAKSHLSPDLHRNLDNLGVTLRLRSVRTGRLENLEETIQLSTGRPMYAARLA